MTIQKAFMDVTYEVGMQGDPVITISPDPDAPESFVRVFTNRADAKEYWGEFYFSIPKVMAHKLGAALIAAAGN